MFTFETADQKEVRRFRIAQFNGRPATIRSGGTTVTGLVRSVLPAWRSKPAEFFFGKNFPVASPDMQADNCCVEFPLVEALKQVARGSDPNFDQ